MAETNPPTSSAARKARTVLVVAFLLGVWALWLVGQVYRDDTWLTGLFFYIPSPMLVVLLLGGVLYGWVAKRRVLAVSLAGLALGPVVAVCFYENHFYARPSSALAQQPLRLVHWNVFGGRLGWHAIQDALRRRGPDLVVLSEVPRRADISTTAKLFGQGFSGTSMSNLAVFARGTLTDGEWLFHRGGIKIYGIIWGSPQGACRVLVVDLPSALDAAREPRLLRVAKWMRDWRPDIVVGDFNAPRRSRALSPLPTGYVHAYDAAGSGWSYTWPEPFPVYAIDQCIVGERITPVTYDIDSSFLSDHRLQVLDFVIRAGTGADGKRVEPPRAALAPE